MASTNEDGDQSCCVGEKQTVIELVESSTADVSEHGGCHYHVHRHQGKDKEDTGLKGLKYKPLCSCEDQGFSCGCRQPATVNSSGVATGDKQTGVRLESWGKWKCWALGLVVTIISVWLIVYTTLLLLEMV